MSASANLKAALSSTHGTRAELLAAIDEALTSDEPATRMRLYAAFSTSSVKAAAPVSAPAGPPTTTGWFSQLQDAAPTSTTTGEKSMTPTDSMKRNSAIASAVADGRIMESRRSVYEARWETDPVGTERLLTASAEQGGLAAGLVTGELPAGTSLLSPTEQTTAAELRSAA